MRKLLIPLLASLLLPTAVYAWWGKYRSQIEAEEACDKWQENGIKFTRDWFLEGTSKISTFEHINRSCKHEASTRQYLGYVHNTGIKEGQHFKVSESPDGKKRIRKYFRY